MKSLPAAIIPTTAAVTIVAAVDLIVEAVLARAVETNVVVSAVVRAKLLPRIPKAMNSLKRSYSSTDVLRW
ncbi:MAG: hypothetical protein ACJAT6_001291 [Akkermansiaceae bacterium]